MLSRTIFSLFYFFLPSRGRNHWRQRSGNHWETVWKLKDLVSNLLLFWWA